VLKLVLIAMVVIIATALLVALWPRSRRDDRPRRGGDRASRTGGSGDVAKGRSESGARLRGASTSTAADDAASVGVATAAEELGAAAIDPFDEVRSTLVPILVPAAEIDDEFLHLRHVARTDLPGLVTILAYDEPDGASHVLRTESDDWMRDDGELFDTAMRNLRAHPGLPNPVAVDLDSGPTVHVVQGPGELTASMSMILADLPELVGPHGVLVALPTQRVMLLHTLGNSPVLVAIARMVPMMLHHHSAGPNALTTDLWWHRNGSFVQLPYELRSNTLSLRPPEEFVALMNRLGE